MREAWSKFRSWPVGAQVAVWVVVGFFSLAVLGTVTAPDEDEPDERSEVTEPQPSTSLEPFPTTTTETPPTTRPAPTTEPAPAGPELLSFDSRIDGDTADAQGGAYDVCQQFVEQRLTSPGSAEYPDFYEDDGEVDVWRMPNGDYRVNSQVDSENGFGASLRSVFECRVDYIGGGNYRLVQLTVV